MNMQGNELETSLNRLAQELARTEGNERREVTLDSCPKEQVRLTWQIMGRVFEVRPEFVRELAGNWFTGMQMAQYGFLILGAKRAFLSTPRQIALNVGVLNLDDAPRIVRMLERLIPPGALKRIAEIRVYTVTPSDFFQAMEVFGQRISYGDHPIMKSYLKIYEILEPIRREGMLTDSEILARVKDSLSAA